MTQRARIAPIALCTVVTIAWLGCSTTNSRIREHQEAFDAYPERVQQNLRQGVIEVGYTPQMVFIAMGEPDRKVDVANGEEVAQVWTWSRSTPGIGVSLGGWNALGSHVGLGSGMSLGERAHREDVAVVEFRRGQVHRFERLAPN
jgi:hypothetical protein